MFKKFAILTIVAFTAGLFVVPMVSASCEGEPDPALCCDGDPELCKSQVSTRVQSGKMKMLGKWTRVYLYEKDPETWDAIGKGGAFGFLDYRPSGTEFKFLFVGKKLEPGFNYTLIYYPDPWPGNDLICLGSGTANELGKVKIVGKGDPLNPFYAEPQSTGNLPIPGDENDGAKIWLVLSNDVDCDSATPHMTGWTPSEYLFENVLITFVDTDG
ncbi:MAG: hypothetical protein JRJ47_02405 [Deltaproteobacteria bacterium]|nr:hypothetical protein [Deltaproteobacteria bacterium]MBW2195204.1 hypothetical protein [Deltaproteobacteria bacterium]